MYFILSKVLLIFIFPLTWIISLLVAGLIVKKTKQKMTLLIAGTLLLLLFTSRIILNLYGHIWDINPQQLSSDKVYSVAIILGGYANVDAQGSGYFGPLSNRLFEGVKLKNSGRVSHLLITGGNPGLRPGPFKEGDWVVGELKYFCVPDSSILVDAISRNTIENALFSRKLLDTSKLKPPYLLITSIFHMRRAEYIFKKAGINVIPYPCEFNSDSELSADDLLPDASILSVWEMYTKELVGMVVTYFKTIPTR